MLYFCNSGVTKRVCCTDVNVGVTLKILSTSVVQYLKFDTVFGISILDSIAMLLLHYDYIASSIHTPLIWM